MQAQELPNEMGKGSQVGLPSQSKNSRQWWADMFVSPCSFLPLRARYQNNGLFKIKTVQIELYSLAQRFKHVVSREIFTFC